MAVHLARAESSAAVQSLIRLAAATRARHDYLSMGARSAAEVQSYFVTQLRRTIGIGVSRAEAQLAFAVRESSAATRRRCAGWGVRYAEDADHGDPVADMADEFHRARGPAHGGGDRR